jgi:hypothetical protein
MTMEDLIISGDKVTTDGHGNYFKGDYKLCFIFWATKEGKVELDIADGFEPNLKEAAKTIIKEIAQKG